MSVDAAQAKLQRGMKDLLARWRETRESWRDPRAEEFSATYLDELEQDMRATMSALDQLRSVLNQARHDCR